VSDRPFPLSGSTLIVGPSGVGKTTQTARALESWLDRYGPDGTVVFDFGPDIEREGRIVGARLDRYTTIPEGVWTGRFDAHAPRSEGATDSEMVAFARENAQAASGLVAAAPPEPQAVFVNDATIAFQHDAGDLDGLLAYAESAPCVVVNAFEGDDFGTDDPVSRREQEVLAVFREWANRTVELD
jgi:hypothetical protein